MRWHLLSSRAVWAHVYWALCFQATCLYTRLQCALSMQTPQRVYNLWVVSNSDRVSLLLTSCLSSMMNTGKTDRVQYSSHKTLVLKPTTSVRGWRMTLLFWSCSVLSCLLSFIHHFQCSVTLLCTTDLSSCHVINNMLLMTWLVVYTRPDLIFLKLALIALMYW